MKNISILKASVFTILMLSMTYTSCSRKYGCYYAVSTPASIEKSARLSGVCLQTSMIRNEKESSGMYACNP